MGPVRAADVDDVLSVQRLAYRQEAERYGDPALPPLLESSADLEGALPTATVLVARVDGEVVGAVRGTDVEGCCHVGRLVVHPRWQGRGIGSRLLAAVEAAFPDVDRYALFTGHLSDENLRLYARRGYREVRRERLSDRVTLVHLEKPGAPAG